MRWVSTTSCFLVNLSPIEILTLSFSECSALKLFKEPRPEQTSSLGLKPTPLSLLSPKLPPSSTTSPFSLPGLYNGSHLCGHGRHHPYILQTAQGQGEDNEDDHHGDDDGDHQKNDHDDDQVRIFNDVRLEEHHKDLLLYDSNNRLVTTGHLGRLLSESLHP